MSFYLLFAGPSVARQLVGGYSTSSHSAHWCGMVFSQSACFSGELCTVLCAMQRVSSFFYLFSILPVLWAG